MIPPEIIEQIREAADLVQLIGEHVELKRTGADWRGPCPFHGGTHRNFSVVPRKQMYHCFVCHESGDVFTFFMKRFGLDYPSAVREIAGRVGIAVPEQKAQGPDPNEPLYSALGVAADWFARRLVEADDARVAREYLASRQISDAVRDDYRLGYAPRGDAMLEAMRALGISGEVLAGAGLAIMRDDGSVAPRFRGRLIFPIADVRGRVVGFGGRILGEGEPKYLNSPESAVYHKGTLLYGLDRARGAIRTDGFAILVEGYVDCIRLQAAGVVNVVAPLGTSLTGEQARVLRRYTRQVAIAYDADTPGLKSTFRAADELLRQGHAVSVVTLPPGDDPDTLVARQGAAPFRELLDKAVDVIERKLQLIERKGMLADVKGKLAALDRLLPTMRAATDPLIRDAYIGKVAERAGMSREVLEQKVGNQGPVVRPPEAVPEPRATRPAEIMQERMLVRIMLAFPGYADRGIRELDADQLRHEWYRRIFEQLASGAAAPPDDLLELWHELSQPEPSPFDPESEFNAAADWIRDRPRRERIAQIEREIELASAEGKDALLMEKMSLMKAGPRLQLRKGFKAAREPKY
jgi:DNA primase